MRINPKTTALLASVVFLTGGGVAYAADGCPGMGGAPTTTTAPPTTTAPATTTAAATTTTAAATTTTATTSNRRRHAVKRHVTRHVGRL